MRKILIIASLLIFSFANGQDSLVRDVNFGTDGYATISLTPLNTTISWHPSNQNEYFLQALQRPDEKVILISQFRKYGSDSVTFLIRLINSNGTTDATFNGGLGYQSIEMQVQYSDYASAILAADGSVLVMPGQIVFRLDPNNNYGLDATFNGGSGLFQFSSGGGTGVKNMNYFPLENLLSLSGSMGNSFVTESRVINATTGLYAGQIDTQDWDFNPFNGNMNSSDCLVNDTLMYQLGSSDVTDDGDYTFFVSIRSFSTLYDTFISFPQVGASFANQKIYGSFLEDKSLLLCFYTFDFAGLPDQIRAIHLFENGSFDSTYGVQTIDIVESMRDAFFTKDYSGNIYLYTSVSNLRRVYKFDENTGYLDNSFCEDGIVNLLTTSGSAQTSMIATNDQSLLVINRAPFNGGVNQLTANSLIKYVDVNQLAIKDNNQVMLTIFPNPSSDFFQLKGEEISNVQLFDALGKIMFTQEKYNGEEISVDHLAKGVYTLNFLVNRNVQQSKLILE